MTVGRSCRTVTERDTETLFIVFYTEKWGFKGYGLSGYNTLAGGIRNQVEAVESEW